MNEMRGCGRVVLLLLAGGMLQAKGPVYMVITGPLLNDPVYFNPPLRASSYDPGAPIERFMQAVGSGERVDVDSESLKDRPYLYLSEYWGADWMKFAQEGGRAESLRPEQANWRGRFYPAAGGLPAILEMDPPYYPVNIAETRYFTITAEGLQTLKEMGLPIRIDR